MFIIVIKFRCGFKDIECRKSLLGAKNDKEGDYVDIILLYYLVNKITLIK